MFVQMDVFFTALVLTDETVECTMQSIANNFDNRFIYLKSKHKLAPDTVRIFIIFSFSILVNKLHLFFRFWTSAICSFILAFCRLYAYAKIFQNQTAIPFLTLYF